MPAQPRCQHPQCNRFVKRTDTYCAEHRAHEQPRARSGPQPPEIEIGTYRVLLDNELRTTLAKATSEILEKGLIDELGALRVVLLRVLVEEPDLAKLVTNITRIVTVAAQAMRVQHAVSGEQATSVTESVGNLLASLLSELPAESSDHPKGDQQ